MSGQQSVGDEEKAWAKYREEATWNAVPGGGQVGEALGRLGAALEELGKVVEEVERRFQTVVRAEPQVKESVPGQVTPTLVKAPMASVLDGLADGLVKERLKLEDMLRRCEL